MASEPIHLETDLLEVLLQLGRAVSTAATMADVHAELEACVRDVLRPDAVFICRADRSTGLVRVVHGEPAATAEVTYPASGSEAIREGHAVAGEASIVAPELRGDSTHALVAPIAMETVPVGEVVALRGEAFGRGDRRFLSAVGVIAGIAMVQARRVEEIERRRREAERLEEIGRAVASSLEPQEVLERITDAAIELLNGDVCTVWQRGAGGEARVAASRGPRALPIGASFEVPPLAAKFLIDRREPLYIKDVQRDAAVPESLRALIAVDGPHSALMVPMTVGAEVIGALSVGHAGVREFDPESIRLLERLTFQAAAALENARLHAEIRALSLTDALTGLPNRRHLDMVLAKEFAAAQRGRIVAVAMFDLDRFKAYNDARGHQAGDDALRAFARILQSETRAMNLAARYGGDEFVCVISDTPMDGVRAHIQRVVDRVNSDESLGVIGVTAGVATWDEKMKGPGDLIRRADEEMYRLKNAAEVEAAEGVAESPPEIRVP